MLLYLFNIVLAVHYMIHRQCQLDDLQALPNSVNHMVPCIYLAFTCIYTFAYYVLQQLVLLADDTASDQVSPSFNVIKAAANYS